MLAAKTVDLKCQICLCSREAGIDKNSIMASTEEVIEPVAQSSAAQNLGRRRFTKDIRILSSDEIDGLMSGTGETALPLL